MDETESNNMQESEEELDDNYVTLTDEEGTEMDFYVLHTLELDGKTYKALIPDDEDGEEDEYVILRLETDDNGESMLVTIDDDEEFDKVADAFEDVLSEDLDYDGAGEETPDDVNKEEK